MKKWSKLRNVMQSIPVSLKIGWLRAAKSLLIYDDFVRVLVVHKDLESRKLVESVSADDLRFVCRNKLFPRTVYWYAEYLVVALIKSNLYEELEIVLDESPDAKVSFYSLVSLLNLAMKHKSLHCFDVLSLRHRYLHSYYNFKYSHRLCTNSTLKRLICNYRIELLRILYVDLGSPTVTTHKEAQRLLYYTFRYAKDDEFISNILQFGVVRDCRGSHLYQHLPIEIVYKFCPLSIKSREFIEEVRKLLAGKWKGYDAIVKFRSSSGSTLLSKNLEIWGFFIGKRL